MINKKKSTIALFLTMLFVTSTIFSFPVSAAIPNEYNLTGTWTWDYHYGGKIDYYTHTLMITSFNPDTGYFSGTGLFNLDDSYTSIVTGSVTESGNVEFTIDYTGTNPTYYVECEGIITSDGLMMSGIANGGNEGNFPTQRNVDWDATKDEEAIIFLKFPEGSDAIATVEIIEEDTLPTCIPDLPEGILTIAPYIDVKIIAGSIEGTVTVGYSYDETGLSIQQERKLSVYMACHCVDFNEDGTINGQDLSILKKAIKNGDTQISTEKYGILSFDLNDDDKYNKLDENIVKDHMTKGLVVNQGKNDLTQARLPWLDITTYVDTENNIIYGETDHFSIFRGR